MFNFLSFFYSIYIPAIRKKKALIHLTWVSIVGMFIISNFEVIRYSESKDKNGNKYIYDRITGQKWKAR